MLYAQDFILLYRNIMTLLYHITQYFVNARALFNTGYAFFKSRMRSGLKSIETFEPSG